MKTATHTLLVLATILCLSACNKNVPNDGIPSYIRVPETVLSTTSGQGSNSHNISDVWVEIDGSELGVYEYPTTFPVLGKGSSRIIVQAGIKYNGVSATRRVYPFYLPFDTTINLIEKQTVNLTPRFKYKPSTVFALNESFESGNSFDGASVITTGPNVFEGGRSGFFTVDEINPQGEIKMLSGIALPKGTAVFVEFDYKAENIFRIGIEATRGLEVIRFEKTAMSRKDDWNKIYIDFSQEVSDLNADTYKFFYRATLEDSLTSAEIYLDNFKVVHL